MVGRWLVVCLLVCGLGLLLGTGSTGALLETAFCNPSLISCRAPLVCWRCFVDWFRPQVFDLRRTVGLLWRSLECGILAAYPDAFPRRTFHRAAFRWAYHLFMTRCIEVQVASPSSPPPGQSPPGQLLAALVVDATPLPSAAAQASGVAIDAGRGGTGGGGTGSGGTDGDRGDGGGDDNGDGDDRGSLDSYSSAATTAASVAAALPSWAATAAQTHAAEHHPLITPPPRPAPQPSRQPTSHTAPPQPDCRPTPDAPAADAAAEPESLLPALAPALAPSPAPRVSPAAVPAAVPVGLHGVPAAVVRAVGVPASLQAFFGHRTLPPPHRCSKGDKAALGTYPLLLVPAPTQSHWAWVRYSHFHD